MSPQNSHRSDEWNAVLDAFRDQIEAAKRDGVCSVELAMMLFIDAMKFVSVEQRRDLEMLFLRIARERSRLR